MEPQPPAPSDAERQLRVIKTILLWQLVLASGVVFYFARDLFLPLFLAFLIALTLRPVVRFGERRGFSPPVTAAALAIGLGLIGFTGGYFGATPVSNAAAELPMMMGEVKQTLTHVGGSMEQIKEVSEEVEKLAGETGAQAGGGTNINILRSAATGAITITTTLVIALVLATLLLASGNLFYEKLVQSFPAFSDKKVALKAAHDVEQRISRYLLTITVINAGLGLAVAVSFWLLGMPSAIMFGALAFVLNYLPYIGAMIGIVISAGFAILEFGSIQGALPVPLAYLVLTSIEGQFITPVFVGRQLRLNAVAVFVAVVAWAWLWGVTGALMAVPFLVLVKVIADAVPGLDVLSNFLSARNVREPPVSPAPAE